MIGRLRYFLVLSLSILTLLGGTSTELFSQKKNKKNKESNRNIDKSVDVKSSRLFIDANSARLVEDFEKAVKLFEEVLDLDPENAAAKYELARIYFNNGELDRALILAKDASKIDPGNKWYKMLYADLLAYDGQYKQAADLYEQVIYENPDEYEIHFEWAYFLIQANQYKEAIEVYDMLESKIGLDENIIFQKQKLYLQIDDLESAAAELQKLIDSYPNSPEYYGVLAEMYEANGEMEKAKELYGKIIEMDPYNANALIALADISLREGDRNSYMDNMMRIFADQDVDIDVKIRVLYSYIQDYEKGNEKVEEAISLAKILVEAHREDAKSYSIQGDIYYMDDRLEEALSAYNKSLELTKDIFTVWQNVMIIQSDLGKNDLLESTSQEAIELFPLQPLTYYFNGVANYQLKNFEAAEKTFSKGTKVTVDNPLLKAQFYSNLGDVYHELEDDFASDSCYDISLELDPNNPYVLNNYSYYLSLREVKLDKARKMAEKANEIETDNAAFQDTYAWILYKLGKYKEAKIWQLKALENGGEDRPVLLEHYGDILFKLGETNEALKYWQKALDKGSDSSLLGKKIADRKLYED